MQFAILIYSNEEAMLTADNDSKQAMLAAYQSYTKALESAGILRGWQRLRPTAAATTVRISGDKTQVLNGPYAETREQLGGFYLIDVQDLDAAINWGARCPSAAVGTIEVRPIWEAKDY
ncbi:YciI family protein [Labrys neptuniae]